MKNEISDIIEGFNIFSNSDTGVNPDAGGITPGTPACTRGHIYLYKHYGEGVKKFVR